MAQDDAGTNQLVHDHVNYLMSGPAGLGQNFSGYSAYTKAYLTGGGKQPFTVPASVSPHPTWYASESISLIQVLGDPAASRQLLITFTTPSATAPFSIGDSFNISGVNPSFYNGDYGADVVSCTTTQVLIQTFQAYDYTGYPYVSGGVMTKNYIDTQVSTDANARVTIYGPTDRVFIAAQTDLTFDYTTSVSSNLALSVRINRYKGFVDTQGANAANPDYLFSAPVLISEQVYNYTFSTSGTQTVPESIFTSVIDSPSFGYYWYILEVKFTLVSGSLTLGSVYSTLRGLTAQAVKQ